MTPTTDNGKPHPLAVAWDEWLSSDEGQIARDASTLPRNANYLENRLHRAFTAGAKTADFERLAALRVLFDRVVDDLETRICYGCNNRIGWNESPTRYGDWTQCSSCRNARELLKQVDALREALKQGEKS